MSDTRDSQTTNITECQTEQTVTFSSDSSSLRILQGQSQITSNDGGTVGLNPSRGSPSRGSPSRGVRMEANGSRACADEYASTTSEDDGLKTHAGQPKLSKAHSEVTWVRDSCNVGANGENI
eukprot:CAMPEP_0194517512 /NCGR_PEP_ID=MMETSP0253-20130528/50698_1 /TAXON_ID=2966 /ORGANISM="Noctiluca scintillans" /LENGTH=121 /DNA_ID=CAMNT_0039361489 /DNA_START=33 /DNA_END=398 /DNA_ORIENTATION=+